MRCMLVVSVCLVLAATPCLAQDYWTAPPKYSQTPGGCDDRGQSQGSGTATSTNPWGQPGIDQSFHDPARSRRLFEGTQITLSLWLGIETFWDVNPLFAKDPYQTPFASGFGKKVDTVTRGVWVLGFSTEVMPWERPIMGGQMYWSLGGRFWLDDHEQDYPFNRGEWAFELVTKVESTPLFSDYIALSGMAHLGIGHRTWTKGDVIFTTGLGIESSFRMERGSQNAIFLRLRGDWFWEEDGVTATLLGSVDLGWRFIGTPKDLFDDMRIFAILSTARRRDFESTANLDNHELYVGLGGEVRIGVLTLSARLGGYVYENFDLTPLKSNFGAFTNAIIGGAAFNPQFTQIETPGLSLIVAARVEF